MAALNGHAIAGGLILALCCDIRIAAEGKAKFGVNEVPIGVPMPSAFTEIIRFRLGNRVATEAILFGRLSGVREALSIGYIDDSVEEAGLLESAVERAKEIPPNCFSAYAQSKENILFPVLRRIDQLSSELDAKNLKVISDPESTRTQRAALAALKQKSR